MRITDVGVTQLGALSQLKSLDLGRTQITCEGAREPWLA